MKPLYTQEQFNTSKSNDLLQCECYNCKKSFLTFKKYILQTIKGNKKYANKYCSTLCQSNSSRTRLIVNCLGCNICFEKQLSEIKKTSNNFCSQSCSTSYNNKHKSTGNRRSKLEIYLEEQLTILYPNLLIDFNKKDAIGSELDIYIPSLNLAFELNGIFHYEPIYGINKLDQIKNNDISKSKACHDAKIDLCIIDTSSQTYVKPSTSQKYLDIITNIINQRTNLLTS